VTLVLHELRIEQKLFWRSREARLLHLLASDRFLRPARLRLRRQVDEDRGRPGADYPARRDARVRRDRHLVRGSRDLADDPAASRGSSKRLRATPVSAVPVLSAACSARRCSSNALEGSRARRDRVPRVRRRLPGPSRLTGARLTARRGCLRSDGHRAYLGDPVGRGLVRGRQCDLPADAVHSRARSSSRRNSPTSSRRSQIAPSITYFIRLVLDILVSIGAQIWDKPG